MKGKLHMCLIRYFRLIQSRFNISPRLRQHIFTCAISIGVATLAYGLGILRSIEAAKIPVEVVNADGSVASSTPYLLSQNSKASRVAALLGASTTSTTNNVTAPGVLEKKVKATKIPKPSLTKKPKPTPTPLPADLLIRHENASIIGSKKSHLYFFPWCGTVSRLSETNAIVFSSIDEARRAGYAPAKNCKGLN